MTDNKLADIHKLVTDVRQPEVFKTAERLETAASTVAPSLDFRNRLQTAIIAQAHEELGRKRQVSRFRLARKHVGAAAAVLIATISLAALGLGGFPMGTHDGDAPLLEKQVAISGSVDSKATGPAGESGLPSIGVQGLAVDAKSDAPSGIGRDEAIVIALESVDYPAKVIRVDQVQIGGQGAWRISLVRDGMGIPNRDDLLVSEVTGEVTRELAAE